MRFPIRKIVWSLLALLAILLLWANVREVLGRRRSAAAYAQAVELEKLEYRERTLISIGYDYGLAVQRFYREPGSRHDACRQLSFADRDLAEAGLSPDYFNAKLRGLAEVRRACSIPPPSLSR